MLDAGGVLPARAIEHGERLAHPQAQHARDVARGSALQSDAAAGGERRIHIQDRKSTRLNSSHSQISYAVFCLKKKKNLVGSDEIALLEERDSSAEVYSYPRSTH